MQGIKNFDGVKGVKEALEGELRERGEVNGEGGGEVKGEGGGEVEGEGGGMGRWVDVKSPVKRANTKSLVRKVTTGSPTKATTANIAGKADLSKLTVQKVSKLTVQKLKPCTVDGETQTTVIVENPEMGIYNTNMMQI